MNWNFFPFQVKIIGHEPESRCASGISRADRFLVRLVLNQPIRPGDANRVCVDAAVEGEGERRPVVDPFFVIGPRLHFDCRVRRGLEILDALNTNRHPASARRGVRRKMDRAIPGQEREIFAAVTVEIGANGRGCNARVSFNYKIAVVITQGQPLRPVAHQVE